VAGNGLTSAEIKRLRVCEKQLQALVDKGGYFGARERFEISDLLTLVKTRLSPPTPTELEEKTQKILAAVEPIEGLRRAVEEASAA
jgi:hypothetical protein